MKISSKTSGFSKRYSMKSREKTMKYQGLESSTRQKSSPLDELIKSKKILIATVISIILIGAIGSYGIIYVLEKKGTASESSLFEYSVPESQGISSEVLRELADEVDGYFEDELIVGAELMVIKNRKIVLHEVVGWKDRENELPMPKNTISNIRSMTKPITGSAIQVLIDEGRLSLETRVAEILPGFDNEKSRNITVRHLLTHFSGLPLSIITTTNEFESLQSMANEIGVLGPEYTPGSKFWYSDAGAEVLGAMVEIMSGSSLETYVKERIFDPLGMNDSLYYVTTRRNDTRKSRIGDLYAGGTGKWVKAWIPEEPLYAYALGSQSVYCTPLDYARFLAMWMDGGQAGGKQVLSSEAINRVLTPVSKMGSLGSDMPYPTGFYDMFAYYGQMAIIYADDVASDPSNVRVIGHSGSDGTYAWAWPDQDLIILYFTQSRGSSSGIKLESKIDELLIHPELREINKKAREKYAKYLGSYTANFGPHKNEEYKVTVQNGCLSLDIPDQIVFELDEPDEEGKWHFKTIDDIAISFDYDEHGNVTRMNLHQGGYSFEIPKGMPPEEDPYPEDMEIYVGIYETEDPNIPVDVLIHEGRLALKITGQPAILELNPPDDEGRWFFRINPHVSISFNKNEDGKVISFTAHLPDGTTLLRPRIESGEK